MLKWMGCVLVGFYDWRFLGFAAWDQLTGA